MSAQPKSPAELRPGRGRSARPCAPLRSLRLGGGGVAENPSGLGTAAVREAQALGQPHVDQRRRLRLGCRARTRLGLARVCVFGGRPHDLRLATARRVVAAALDVGAAVEAPERRRLVRQRPPGRKAPHVSRRDAEKFRGLGRGNQGGVGHSRPPSISRKMAASVCGSTCRAAASSSSLGRSVCSWRTVAFSR